MSFHQSFLLLLFFIVLERNIGGLFHQSKKQKKPACVFLLLLMFFRNQHSSVLDSWVSSLDKLFFKYCERSCTNGDGRMVRTPKGSSVWAGILGPVRDRSRVVRDCTSGRAGGFAAALKQGQVHEAVIALG